jgi:uncharacterized repeat protein (TIGR01451 family)
MISMYQNLFAQATFIGGFNQPNYTLYDSGVPNIHGIVVYYPAECVFSDIFAFLILIESDTINVLQTGMFMVLKNGEIRAFYSSERGYGEAALKNIAKLMNALRDTSGTVPASTVLILLILLFSVEKASAQWVNSDFSAGSTGWTSTAPANSSLTYSGGQLIAVSKDNGGGLQRAIASQSLTSTDPGFFTYSLVGWTTADYGQYDFPTVQIGGTYYYITSTGTLQTGWSGAAIDNDDAAGFIGPISGRQVLTSVNGLFGVGVAALDSCCGPGTARWDDVDVQELTQSPGAQTTPFNTALTLSGSNAPQVATNSGAATMTITLSVTNGILNLGSTAGITITSGSNGSATMTFTGSPTNINNALNNLQYTPTSGYSGASTLTFFANGGGASDTDTIAITVGAPSSSFTISKTTPTTNVTAAGSPINYTVTVTNNGTGSLTGITISDNVVQGASSTALTPGAPAGDGGVSGVMEAGEIWVYTISHTVTQAQMDDGGNLVNTATFDSAQTTPQSASATTTITTNPSLTLVKSSSASGFITDNILEAPAGTVVTYTYTVTNNGNQTIDNVEIDDSGHTGLGPWVDPTHAGSAIDNGLPGGSADTNADPTIWGELGPQDVIVFSTTYTITQADIDAQ